MTNHQIVPAGPEHATALAPRLRKGDLAEIKARGEIRHLGISYANFVTGAGDGFEVELVQGYARHIGVTPGHLTEAVKAATGRPASALVREARVREAKRLLTGTALTVRQVATRVGFGDPAYFCRFFRRETGVSPGGFRENHHERLD